MKRTYVKQWTRVPLYRAELCVVVSDRIEAEAKKLEDVFGKYEEDGTYVPGGMHLYNKLRHKYAILIDPEADPGLIAHECWHCTNRIMEALGVEKDMSSGFHEMGGYLIEWMCQHVHDSLTRARQLKK